MAFWDSLRKHGEKPALYRQQWAETSNPLVAEARSQTLAIQQLQLWLRLAYSALALAVLMGYWGFVDGGNTVVGILGVVLCMPALIAVIVLRTGIRNGRQNVEAMLRTLESEHQVGD